MREPEIYPSEIAEEIRRVALDAIIKLRDGGNVAAPAPNHAGLQRIIEFVAGGEVSADYLPLLEEELSLTDADPRAPKWRKESIDPQRPFKVAVIGAGMSGLLGAYRLQQAGIDFVILEKNPEVGGTWFENSYPGCRVDVANHFYSYSFAQRPDGWPRTGRLRSSSSGTRPASRTWPTTSCCSPPPETILWAKGRNADIPLGDDPGFDARRRPFDASRS